MLLRLDGPAQSLAGCAQLASLATSLANASAERLQGAEQSAADGPDLHNPEKLADGVLATQLLFAASALAHAVAGYEADPVALANRIVAHCNTISRVILPPGLAAGTADIAATLAIAQSLQQPPTDDEPVDAANAAKRRKTAAKTDWRCASAEATLLYAAASAAHDLAMIVNAVADEFDKASATAAAAADGGQNATATTTEAAEELEQLAVDLAAACNASWQALQALLSRYCSFCAAATGGAAVDGSALAAGTDAFVRSAAHATEAVCRGEPTSFSCASQNRPGHAEWWHVPRCQYMCR
jgi:hypothetical protein